jgi:hypothetical protein
VRLQKQLLLQLQISERGGREDAAAETYSMLQEEREVWGVVWVKLFWCERCLEKSDKFWEKGVRHPYSVVSVACSLVLGRLGTGERRRHRWQHWPRQYTPAVRIGEPF